MVSFLIGSDLMTMITSMEITMMMVVTLKFIKSMKWINKYTSVGKRGQQRLEQMAEIQKIVTSAGWLDQCPDGPPSIDFVEIEPEELPPSQWNAAVQKKHQQVLAETCTT
jgi:hypothetical protein